MAKKSLSERISERMRTKKPSVSGKNRAAFLAVKSDVKLSLEDHWPVKVIWETLYEEGSIDFGYETFLRYVKLHISSKSSPTDAMTEADPAAKTGSEAKKTRQKEKASKPKSKELEPESAPAKSKGFNYQAKPNEKDLI